MNLKVYKPQVHLDIRKYFFSVRIVDAWNSRMLEYSFSRLFVPWNIRSHDGTFVLGTICSLELSFSRLFFPWKWNIRSLDCSFPGTFVPGTLDLSCRGPFVHLSAEQYLVHLQRRSSVCISLRDATDFTDFFRTVDILLLFIFHSRPLKIIILRTQ